MTESVHPVRDEHDDARDVGAEADEAQTPESSDQTGGAAGQPSVEDPVGSTGNAQVDEAVRGVLELGDRPVEEHVEVFEQAHTALRGALNDAAAGRTAPAPGAGLQGLRPTPPGPRPGQG